MYLLCFRYKCSNNFNEDVRNKICEEYWSLGDSCKQKMFLASCIQNVPVQRRKLTAVKNKATSRQIFLKYTTNPSTNSKKRVCLKFLCSTLSISHRVVEICMKRVSECGTYIGHDGRSGKKPPNLTLEVNINYVKEHIDSFPRVESHYCRKDSKKLYLSSELNISIMYRLYKNEFCINKQINPVSCFVYSKIFHSYEPALSFFIPKKDQCHICNAYALDKNYSGNDYEQHKQREKTSMDMKKADKMKAIVDNGKTFRSITFDLQGILTLPYAGDNQLYYKRKFNIYNFTIFDAYNKTGHCFVWDECNAKKGSNEIGSCLLKYLFQLPLTVNHVAAFSDTCGGQNRNKHVCAAMLYAVNKIDNLEIVDLKFMETGHSYLEVDAMHATIERGRKHKKVYTTREWALLISAARINPFPYNVHTLKILDFYDLKQLSSRVIKNSTKRLINMNEENEKVEWLKIKWLRFEKSKSQTIQFKYDLNSTLFFEIDVAQCNKRTQTYNWTNITLKEAYPRQIPISENKKKDLLFLLKSKIIPSDYKSFYESIPSSSRQKGNDSDYDEI